MPFSEDISNAAEIWQNTLAWQPNAQQQAKFVAFYQAMLMANTQVNLTRITNAKDFWEKHLWDALSGIQPWLMDLTLDPGAKVVDIGSGAGVPGVPVAIARPDWQITLLEARRKKVSFLESLPSLLDLNNLEAVWSRAEDYQPQASFDLALMRAVGTIQQCLRFAMPLIKPGGRVILYRGQMQEGDQQDLERELQHWQATLEQIQAGQTPLTASTRHCLVIRSHTPHPH